MSDQITDEHIAKKRKIEEMDDDDEFDNFCLDFSFDDFTKKNDLDLSKWTRCIVDKYERDPKTFDILLCVREDQAKNELNLPKKFADLRLQGPWSHTKVSVGDIVSCLAVWNDQLNVFSISYDAGFCVVHPDTLISGTSVVGALFCQRKGVLSDRFTGIDCSNKIMAIGSIVHELFQTVISQQLATKKQIEQLVGKMINTREMIYQLYETKMTIDEIRGEFNKFIPNILKFMHRYITGDDDKIENDTFNDKIDNIQDIEENIWLPRLGLKGKVDVSVEIRRRNKFFDSDIELLPLEIKTGRASFSSEHRGQLIIYQMMMSANEIKPIKSGLLLYLRDGVMKEIIGTRSEQRDLIMLRNEVAYYITKSDQSIEYKKNLNKTFNIPILPDPINHHSACGSCSYQTICCTVLSRDPEKLSELKSNHPLRPLMKNLLQNVTPEHIDYFIHWTGILSLEERELCRSDNELKTLWTDTPENREKRRKAISNLIIMDSVLPEHSNTFIHKFKKNPNNNTKENLTTEDLTLCGLNVGDYIRVSTHKRINIAAGRVLEITPQTITLSLERNLKLRYRDEIFILDKNNSQTLIRFNLANLGALLDQTEAANQLRSIIVDRIQPTFTPLNQSMIEHCARTLSKLNAEQRMAIQKALTVNEYLLLKGLPGTGKTQTLVGMVEIFIKMGKSILITSHTHSAVDNLLERIREKRLKFLRLGDSSRVAESIRDYCEENVIQNCRSPEELDRIYLSFPIVGVTCLGANHPMLVHRTFDVCIVDESTQVFQPTIIRPLLCAKKFILVGDPKQLPPIIQSKEAISFGADESLFERLDDKETATLTLHYRMNKQITIVANKLTYGGLLDCATTEVCNATLKIKNQEMIDKKLVKEKWLLRPLSTHIDNSVVLLETGNCFNRSEEFMNSMKTAGLIDMELLEERVEEKKIKSRITENYCETGIVMVLLRSFLLGGVDGKEIGVIAPYNNQVDLIKRNIEKCIQDGCENSDFFKSVEVSTVDRFQGRDKQIIIYSCTKCDNPASTKSTTTETVFNGEILNDIRRLTVAITRSKYKLIIIGDVDSLKTYKPFEILFESIPKMTKVSLSEGNKGFYWTDIRQNLLDTNILF